VVIVAEAAGGRQSTISSTLGKAMWGGWEGVWKPNPTIASQKLQESNHTTSDQRLFALPVSHALDTFYQSYWY
jgi:hypothetical protein